MVQLNSTMTPRVGCRPRIGDVRVAIIELTYQHRQSTAMIPAGVPAAPSGPTTKRAGTTVSVNTNRLRTVTTSTWRIRGCAAGRSSGAVSRAIGGLGVRLGHLGCVGPLTL